MFESNDILRARAEQESQELLERQLEIGSRVIEKRPWASDLFDQMKGACPNVNDDDLMRLFVGRDEDEVQRILGDAMFLEYNLLTRPES